MLNAESGPRTSASSGSEGPRPLSGQVALVTGAALRVGREITQALADGGADVVIHYRDSREAAEEFREELVRGGSGAWTIRADLSEPAEAERLIGRVRELARGLEILVNSASAFPPSRLATLDLESLEELIRVNAWAPLVLGRSMAAQARSGRIVNLLDSRALAGDDREHAGYAITKLVLAHLTRMLALELAPGFTVNAVAPGPVLAPSGRPDLNADEYLRARAQELPLKRAGSPRDVARAVLFLVESPFVTGQTIFVDGGDHLR